MIFELFLVLTPNFLAAPKTLTGHPRKVKEETAVVVRKRGGLGEPVLKNARVVANEDLCPMGLLVPDQDFGDYIGCQGAFFKRELAGKVGHFVSSLYFVSELFSSDSFI